MRGIARFSAKAFELIHSVNSELTTATSTGLNNLWRIAKSLSTVQRTELSLPASLPRRAQWNIRTTPFAIHKNILFEQMFTKFDPAQIRW
jgi:hypothetical protein